MVSKEELFELEVYHLFEKYGDEIKNHKFSEDLSILAEEQFKNDVYDFLRKIKNEFDELINVLLRYRFIPEIYQSHECFMFDIKIYYSDYAGRISTYAETTQEYINLVNRCNKIIGESEYNIEDYYRDIRLDSIYSYEFNTDIDFNKSEYLLENIIPKDDNLFFIQNYMKKYAVTNMAKNWDYNR